MVVSTHTGQSAAYQAINWIYRSFNQAKPFVEDGPDAAIRHPEWTRRILDALGSPDRQMYNVAVTGSKGKGSHAILTAAILQRLGFKVGLFTGPHLVDFMERFRINGEVMPEEQFIAYVEELKTITEAFQLPKEQYFGPVGLLSVIAVLWFLENHTDVNIFELGRGALHDDVNQVEHVGAIIAPVFLEHQRELGNTLADVGREKAGVVTDTTRFVFTHGQSAAVEAAIQRAVKIRETISSDFVGDGISETSVSVLGTDFVIEDVVTHAGGASMRCRVGQHVVRLDLPLENGVSPAEFLVSNAAVAMAAALKIAFDLNPGLNLPTVISIEDVRLPGRLQTIRVHPEVIVDGTIHGQSAGFIRDYLRNRRANGYVGKIGACVGIPADKDGIGVIRALCEDLDWVVLCKAHNAHLKFDESLEMAAREMMEDVQSVEFLEGAISLSMSRLDPQTDLLLILGTQSLVGDALRYFEVDTKSIWRKREGLTE